ncbi:MULTISPECIES: hypothetical protein [unclassified Streptomyces]|uniref:hypothetical protein n=1 Tax=unclassified Streptomyces TaxID=2593676 RepID=UPI0035D880CD
MARSRLAGAARLARWADAALGPGRGGPTTDDKATLSDATAERAAADLGLTAAQVRADWDTARLAGLIEVHGDNARPGWRLRAWHRDDSAVLRGWVALFDAWSLACPEPEGHEAAAVAEVVSAMPQVLSFLQLSAGPVPVEQLLDLLRQRVTELRTDRCEVPYDPDAAGPAPDGATTATVDPAPEPKTGLRAAPTAVSDDAAASAPDGAATAESSAAASGLGAVSGLRAAPAVGPTAVSDSDDVAASAPGGAATAESSAAATGIGAVSGLRPAPAARPTAVSDPDSAAAAASGPAPGAGLGLGPEDGASAPAIHAPEPAAAVSATHTQAPGGPAAAVSGPGGQGAPAPGGALAAVREAGSAVTALSGAAAEGTSLAPLLDWALRALAAVGALTDGDGQATLTPLGSWAVWVKLEQICVAAQSPAGNIEQSAEDMLRGCAQLRPNAARAEYRAWLAARPVGSAVTELLGGARGEDALLRGLAFEALRVVGAPAEPDVRAVLDEPALRPYALLWLAEHDGVDAEDAHEVLTREEATWLWVDTAAAVTDHGEASMLVRHLEAAVQPTVPMLLDEVRTVGHPRTVQVLVALAAAHPDPALAKAVRRAAFQVHTGGS